MNLTTIRHNRNLIRLWLAVVLLAIFALILVGGATRLTDSGLSITQWKPLHGIIPPLNLEDWMAEFELYKQIPEYTQINQGMSLNDFKFIYWWEWAHRFLARSIGVLFGAPLLILWLTGRIEKRLKLPLVGLLILGGLQGALGWWMVASGLVDRVDVSQYRLASHLTLACIIFAAIFWVFRALSIHTHEKTLHEPGRFMAAILCVLVLVQIYLGGLVAGLDAGLSYNTWPLMDGAIVPTGIFVQEPLWINFFENPKLVQFTHRMNAYLLFALSIFHVFSLAKHSKGTTHARRGVVFLCLITMQVLLGVITLVLQVPIFLGLIHQGAAIVVLAFIVAHWRGFYGEYALPKYMGSENTAN